MTTNEFVEQAQHVINGIADAIRKFLQPIVDWFNSPQVRRFFKQLTTARQRVGIVSKVPVRKRTRSTKRMMIYQRRALLV